MKFELEEKDKKYIDRVNEDLNSGERPPLFISQLGKEYTFKFKCIDIAKANLFASIFMNPDYTNLFNEIFGVEILSLNFNGLEGERDKVKQILQNCIDELDMENDIFQLEYSNDYWYPSGSAKVNMDLFKEINRSKEKRPVWVFKGDSALGKSYLAGIIANSGREKSVYETDAHEELGDIHEDIVVIGNKYKHSVEDVESHILGEHEVILVDFSKA